MLWREECGNQKPFLVKYCEESDYDHHGFGDLLALCGNQVKSNHCHNQDERVIIASVKRPFTIRNGDKSKKDRNGKGQKSTVLLGHSCKIGNMRCPGTLKNKNPQFEEKK